jgi:hypothetical protein
MRQSAVMVGLTLARVVVTPARRRSFAICFALVLLGLVSGVQGAYSAGRPSCLVSNERTGSGSRSLQEGIDTAAAGDTLVVHGTCVGNSTIDKDLRLRGVSNKPFGVATLDGSGFSDSVLTIVSGGCCVQVTVAIDGLTIANGSSSFGGGIINFGSAVTLTKSIVTDNDASVSGGGIANFGDGANFGGNPSFIGELTLIDSSVGGNDATNGGGGIYNAAGGITLTTSTVSGNEAGVGGGIIGGGFGRFSNFSFTNSTVTGNAASGSGGGIALFGRAGLTMTSSAVSSNTAGGDGGGIYGEFNTGGSLFVSTVTGNTAGGAGGGIFSNFSSFFLSNSTVSNNTATDGGGIYNSGAINQPGFVRFGSVMLVNSIVSGNTASNRGGGVANFDGRLTVTDSTLSGNEAGVGGGIFNSGGMVTLTGNNIFINNDPDDCSGVAGC